ncbi:MAG: hypothetical protein NTW38_00970 [Candidatus Aminicenantes bacterium]|nr:hypothetical protein [Candidatus Aminicenantes bacterium]
MDHSYEELRAAALDVLAGREKAPYDVNQYEHLSVGVAEAFARREQLPEALRGSRQPFRLTAADRELFLEVFWDLFRQGIITLGYNDSNREFPFFHLSRLGQRLIENQDTYFFHDVASYTKWLKDEVPHIDPVTLLYVQEALQAFRSGCILSSSVMLGVATEHTFLLLVEAVERSPTYAKPFAAVGKERTILCKVNKFKSVLDQQQRTLPPEVKEDLDTRFAGILSVIRTVRNQAGHPTGRILDREQAFILLQLFIPYCRKMYQLMEHLGK